MREIKFRGKRFGNRGWAYGDLHLHACTPHIHPHEDPITNKEHEFIIPETIGQFTGLHDRSGKEIYEGDIVAFTPDNAHKSKVHAIKYCGASFTLADFCPLNYPNGCYEVIGNIHDNPELLNK